MIIEKALTVGEVLSHHIVLQPLLRKKKCACQTVSSLPEALESLRSESFDWLFCFWEGQDGPVLAALQQEFPALRIVVIAEAVRRGAIPMGIGHFIELPLTEEALCSLWDQQSPALPFKSAEITKHQLIVESDMMKQILSDIHKIAKSASSVFISGESGTGKEVIAHAIHSHSPRNLRPFIKVNCAAIPATLLESEFFGHEKGAFTGALNKKLGRFELAHTGTLLLDEVSEIPLELQAKLLRAVQEREFERVGGVHPLQVDVRLISTSNRPMKEAIEEKQFREDLYYRLNVIPLHLPPLRERTDDILPLAEFFLRRLCEENQKPLKRLCADAKRKLIEYPWPGNIRELANVIERTVIMNTTASLEAHQIYLDLSCPVKESPAAKLPVGITLAELEKRLILETLSQEKGNRTRTATILGISLRTLRNKLREYANSVA